MTSSSDYEIKDGVLVSYKGNDVDLTIPETVKVIGGEAFMYCDSLKNITIPNSVKSIGNYAFSGCSNLKSVTIPDSVTTLGNGAFEDCSSLKDVSISDSLTSIPMGAFCNCSSLKEVTIPDSITSIEMNAFFGCSSLKTVKIPDSVTEINGWAFDECPDLTIYASSNCAEEYAKWKNIRLDNGEYVINPIIGEPGVKRATKNSRKYIVDEKWSFELPKGLELYTNAEHVDLMGSLRTKDYVIKGLQENGRYLFDFELREVYDDGMATDCDVLSCRYDNDVTLGNAEQAIMQDGDDFYVDVIIKPVLFAYGMYEVRVRGEGVRPRSFTASLDQTDEELMSKWSKTGEGNMLLKQLVESIKLIDSKKKTAKKKTISDLNFIVEHGILRRYVGSDTDITIPEGIKEIADSTFSGFTKLKSVVVPEGIKKIGRRCFENCYELESVQLPESLEELGGYAFVDCHKLKEVYLSERLKVIGDSAFSECFVLKDVKIPEEVTVIDSFVFKNCHEFKHIVIPEGATVIGVGTFAGCKNLEYLFIPESVTEFVNDFSGNHPLAGCNKLIIYTPAGSPAQQFAAENGIPYQNVDKGSVTADNSAAKARINDSSSPRSSESSEAWEFPTAWNVKVKEELIDNQSGYPIRFLPHSIVKKNWEHEMTLFQHNCLHNFPEHIEKVHVVIEHANKYVTLFKENGTAEDLQNGKLKNSAPIHALRSLIWTVTEMQKESKESFPIESPQEMWPAVAQFISRQGNINYKPAAKNSGRFGIPLLNKEEVCSIYTDACDYEVAKYGEWMHKNDAIGSAMKKATENSLFDVVDSLHSMIPVMDYYFDYLQNGIQKDGQTINTIGLILQGWLSYAFASRQPFFIVPGKLYEDDIEFSEVPDWTQLPETKDIESGKFTLFGSELIKFNDDSPTLVIPEGVTGIVVDDVTRPELERNFANTRKIIYPHSFVGPIVVPEHVKTIEVLGDHEVLRMSGVKSRTFGLFEKTDLEEIKLMGVPKTIGQNAFSGAKKAKKIVVPEGTERLNNFPFSGLDHVKIMLPESLKKIDRDVFSYGMCLGLNTEIYVYKQCPVLGKIKNQLERYKKFVAELNSREQSSYSPEDERIFNIKLIELESPWVTRAESFVKELEVLYNCREPGITESAVKTILNDTIETEETLEKCKKPLITKAKEKRMNSLVNSIKKTGDNHVLYNSLPKELADDINQCIERRIKEEREQRINEISLLSQSDITEDINKAILILQEHKEEIENAEDMIQSCHDRINAIIEDKYSGAIEIERETKQSRDSEQISCKQAIQNYRKAIAILREVESNKNVTADIERCQTEIKELEKRIKYDSVTTVPPKTVQEYKLAILTLQEIPGFMDADAIVERYQETVNNHYYQEGLQSARERTVDGLENGLSTFRNIADYKDAAVLIEKCEKLIDLTNQRGQLKSQLPQFEGFFKRKQRKELETQIAEIETEMSKVDF